MRFTEVTTIYRCGLCGNNVLHHECWLGDDEAHGLPLERRYCDCGRGLLMEMTIADLEAAAEAARAAGPGGSREPSRAFGTATTGDEIAFGLVEELLRRVQNAN